MSELFTHLNSFPALHTLRLDNGDIIDCSNLQPTLLPLGLYKIHHKLRALILKRVTLPRSFFSLELANLERLQLEACPFVGEEGDDETDFSEALNVFLMTNSKVSWLHVAGCKMGEVLAQLPALHNRAFSRIELPLNGIVCASAVLLKNINVGSLLHLNLRENWIHHSGFLSLLSLVQSTTHLLHLDLSRNAILK